MLSRPIKSFILRSKKKTLKSSHVLRLQHFVSLEKLRLVYLLFVLRLRPARFRIYQLCFCLYKAVLQVCKFALSLNEFLTILSKHISLSLKFFVYFFCFYLHFLILLVGFFQILLSLFEFSIQFVNLVDLCLSLALECLVNLLYLGVEPIFERL